MRRLILALLFNAGLAQAQTSPDFPNLVFATVGGQPLMLDLYLPTDSSSTHPLLVWIHGGGWSGGSRFPAPGFAVRMTESGFAVASISYRLSGQAGQWGTEPVIFPAQIHDVKAAIRWLRAHAADYQIDPDRIGVWGSSAGGHLAALAGTSGNNPDLEGSVGTNTGTSSAVQAAVDYFGPTNIIMLTLDITDPPGNIIDHDAPDSPESRLIGFDQPGEGMGVLRNNLDNLTPPFPALVELATQVNPETWADIDDPPFMIAHGSDDMSVPIGQSERLRDTLTSLGRAPVYVRAEGAGHGSLPAEVQTRARLFLQDRLSPLLVNGFDPSNVR
jgi:acetyl esterase/lipase